MSVHFFGSSHQGPLVPAEVQTASIKEDKQVSAEHKEAKTLPVKYQSIIEQEKVLAARQERDPAKVEQALTKLLITAEKAGGEFVAHHFDSSLVFVAKWDSQEHKLTILSTSQKLGKGGSFVKAYALRDLITGGDLAIVLKQPRMGVNRNADKASKNIHRGAGILNVLHKKGHIRGIQDKPLVVMDLNPVGGDEKKLGVKGALAHRFDCELSDKTFRETASIETKFAICQDIANGLKEAHDRGVVHRDIKATNCCIAKGEGQIADWDDACKLDDVSPREPLGVHTEYLYTRGDYEDQNMLISAKHNLHLAATGHLDDLLEILQHMNNTLLDKIEYETEVDSDGDEVIRFEGGVPVEKQDQTEEVKAFKLYIADKIKDLDDESLMFVGIDRVRFSHETEEIQRGRATPPADFLKRFKLDANELKALKVASEKLAKNHDVYCSAVTTLITMTTHPIPSTQEESEGVDPNALCYKMVIELSKKDEGMADYLYSILIGQGQPTAEQFARFMEEHKLPVANI